MDEKQKTIQKKVVVKKMAILGDVFVGKTSIAIRYHQNS